MTRYTWRAALREDAGDDRRLAIDGGERVADRERAHRPPAARRSHERVERLGLAHARSSGHDHEIPRLQSRRHLVEIREAGGHAGDVRRIVAVVERLDAVDDLREQLADLLEVRRAARALLGDVQHLRFRFVEHRLRITALRPVRGLRDLGCGRRKLPQDRALAHDRSVVTDVRRGGYALHQRTEVGEAADVIELLDRGERLGQRDDVRRLAVGDQLRDVAIQQPVRFGVEVVRREHVADLVGRLVVEQQPAEHRLLGLDRMRGSLIESS